MQCPRCASDVLTGAKFCLECGSSLADPGADTMFMDQDESLIVLRSLQRILAAPRSKADQQRTRAALKPESNAASTSRKEQALIARRRTGKKTR